MLRDIFFFITPLLKIRFKVPAKRVETASSKLLYAVTSNQILKTVAMKNNIIIIKKIIIVAN